MQTSRKILHITLGILLLVLGVVGVVLPIVNGTVLLIIGFILLSFESAYIEKNLMRLTQKNKLIHAVHIKLDSLLRKFFRK